MKKRESPRLSDYDYSSSGAYFVTICTKNKMHVLGEVISEEVNLSREGEIVKEIWEELPEHYSNIRLDEFIIMPNHMHGILWILEDEDAKAGEGLRPSPTEQIKRHGLPEFMRAFKSFSAREINNLRETTGTPFWQRSFYEHIIRDDDDLFNHRKYIQENPLKWELDEYYKEQPL